MKKIILLFSDSIDKRSNVSFGEIESLYLERGLPLIIIDSGNRLTLDHFFQLISDSNLENFQGSNRICDIRSNLMLKSLFHTEIALEKALKLTEKNESWFLQIRFCQFESVKESRALIKKPYYYPFHWEPFYSSWFLISHKNLRDQILTSNDEGNQRSNRHKSLPPSKFSQQYPNSQGHFYADNGDRDAVEYKGSSAVNDLVHLHLNGLIVIQQLSGSIEIELMPRYPCEEVCSPLGFFLMEGEALVVTTDLWQINYRFIETLANRNQSKKDRATTCQDQKDQFKDISIASIMEFEWNP